VTVSINFVTDLTTSLSGTTISANNTQESYQWLNCNSGFTEISGATNQTFNPPLNGSFAVELTENGCVDTSACVNITTLNNQESILDKQIKIFPNPTKGMLIIVDEIGFDFSMLTVRNVLGQEIIKHYFFNNNRIELNLDLPSGIYFIEVANDIRKSVFYIRKE
jgi:hypothetical protein